MIDLSPPSEPSPAWHLLSLALPPINWDKIPKAPFIILPEKRPNPALYHPKAFTPFSPRAANQFHICDLAGTICSELSPPS